MARILLIEDNPDNLELMRFLLDSFGHAALCARDAATGITKAREVRPELILCDIHLPVMDGYQAAIEIRQDSRLADIPLVAVTALVHPHERDRALAAGFSGYIEKPIDPERFVGQVIAYLRDGQGNCAGDGGATRPEPIVVTDSESSNAARIVALDDTSAGRERIYRALLPSGHLLMIADNMPEALDLVRTAHPDLVLCHLRRFDVGGFEFVRRVKTGAKLANIPFVLLNPSGWGKSERQVALRLGVTRIIADPFEPWQLLHTIDACLAERSGVAHGQDTGR